MAKVIDEGGKIKDSHPHVRTCHNQHEFVLISKEEGKGHSDIVITQQDIREVQLAKAAIRAGIQVLLENSSLSAKEIDKVIIAGAFGTYIDISSAITIGMLPSLPLDCFRQVGNAAGMGAKLALLSINKRTEAQSIASLVNYIELANAPNFMETFVQATYLGQYRKHTAGKRKSAD